MRRWSTALVIVIVLTIVFLEHLGLEPDRYRAARAEALAAENQGQCLIRGLVLEAETDGEEKCRVTVDWEGRGKVLLTLTGENADCRALPGRQVEVRAELSLPRGASNPGTFDYRNHLRSEGIFLLGRGRLSDLKVGSLSRNPFRGLFPNAASRFRGHVYDRLKSLEDREDADSAGILTGMLFGSRENLDGDLYGEFQRNGTAHILCVSGLHVGVLYGAVAFLLGRRRRSRMGTAVIGAAMIAYAFLASFAVSVTRAVWMVFLSLAAEKCHRRYDMLSAACVTASGLLIYRPALIHSSGFLLSFSAVISLAVAGGGLDRLPRPDSALKRSLRDVFLPVTAIQAGMAPLNACLFHYFSLAAFLANLPVIFLSAILIPLGMLTGLVSLLPGPFDLIFLLMGRCCGFMAQMMVFFNYLTGAGGRLSWQVPAPSLWMMLGYYLVLWLLLSEHSLLYGLDRRKLRRAGAVLLLLLALTGIREQTRPDLVFVDVGQGDCIHIRTRDGRNYLVDGGGNPFSDYDVGEKVVIPYLLGNGVGKLDGVFISHMDEDHYQGLVSVLENMGVKQVYLYEGYENCLPRTRELLGLTETGSPGICFLRGGDRVLLGQHAEMEVIAPREFIPLTYEEEPGFGDAGSGTPVGEGETDLNRASLVMRLQLRGVKTLLTGDLGEEQEAELAESPFREELACDILKVAHHGSKYSSSETFLEAAGARTAVIQVGAGNRFGHPALQTLERLEEQGAEIFRTDEDGAVLVRVTHSGFQVKTML